MKSPKKSPKTYICEPCDYSTSNKKDYNKHISTRKHENRTLLNKKSQKIPIPYMCENCGKTYKVRNSYWYHVKKCVIIDEKIERKNEKEEEKNEKEEEKNSDENYQKIIAQVVNKNNELQNLLLEQQSQYDKNIKELLPRIGNTTHNTKNEFNLNVFLTEDCKDALNMVDFINSLQIKYNDIENTITSGYTNGISQIFIEGLKALELHKRPLHCSDPINDTLYIKDNNVWEVDKDKGKIRDAIQNVNKKSSREIYKWLESKGNNVCENAIISTIIDPEDKGKSDENIIKNIAKEVIIKK